MLTDVQTPFLGTPSAPLKVKAGYVEGGPGCMEALGLRGGGGGGSERAGGRERGEKRARARRLLPEDLQATPPDSLSHLSRV